MTVTFNNNQIATGTLYEDGTIQVKKGFPVQSTEHTTSFQMTIVSSRKKEPMRIMSLPTENSSMNAVNVLTSRHPIKIKTNNFYPSENEILLKFWSVQVK